MKRDYYEILSVTRESNDGEIKKSYRRLAMEFHPDRNPGDKQSEERFKELAEAYEVLSDPEKRSLYDKYGHQGPRQAGFQGFGGVEDILSHFADMFGGGGGGFGGFGGGRARVERGADLQTAMSITLKEASTGVTKEIDVERLVACVTCKGSGAKEGTQPITCAACGGRGQVAHNQGIFMIATTCPTCRGKGTVVKEKCVSCKGGGVERKKETVSINVPAGIDEGQSLRVPGRGQAPAGGQGQPGDLYIEFQIEPDARFHRDGDDLITEASISFAQAALGSKISVPTLDGDIEIAVDAGTQPGTVKVLRGKGMPNVRGRGQGDLAVRIAVAVPERLSAEQKRLIEELAKLDPPPTPVGAAESDNEGFFFKRKKKKK